MYIVCGDRVECRVRTYAGDVGIEEASVSFSQADLTATALVRGAATWDETDILSITGCDHWIIDAAGKQVAADVLTAEIIKAAAFDKAICPKGPLGTLIASKQTKKDAQAQPAIIP